MTFYVVRQPDGMLAGYSTTIQDFHFWRASKDGAMDFCERKMAMTRDEAEASVKGGMLDAYIWSGADNKGPGTFRWDASLGQLGAKHGVDYLRRRVAEIGFPDYPLDEILAKWNLEDEAAAAPRR